MLRIQLPERSFRFGRKSYMAGKEKANAPEEVDTERKMPPHTPLPLVYLTSTKSLLDLFQSQDESDWGLQTLKNEKRANSTPTSARSMPEDPEKPILKMNSVAPFDALGSNGDPNSMSSMPKTTSVVIPALFPEREHSIASTPSSGSREDDDSSGCSRKSSTSSVGTPLAGHHAYFDAIAAICNEDGVIKIPLLDTQQLISPKEREATPTRSVPQYDKPLPPPPSPERPFSLSSVLSIMRAESYSKAGQQPAMRMIVDAPVISRRQSHMIASHRKSASDGVLCVKTSTPMTTNSPTNRSRSKRGARLGNAISQGRLHSRAQTLNNVAFRHAGSARPERPCPLSMSFNITPTPTRSENRLNRERKSGEELPLSVLPSAAEKVVFEIMRRLDEPADLLASAAVNRRFRHTFKRAEPRLIDEILLWKCPAAWEFQKHNTQVSGHALSLRAYTKDKAALIFIKSALLSSCSSVMHPETMTGLNGVDVACESRIDTALWRIWTFCKGFGHHQLSEEDIPMQVDWLNGGRNARKLQVKTAVGRGNRKGLSLSELEDLLELWDYLGVMLSSFNGNVTTARAVGIFERCTLDEAHTEEWFLQEWFYYIKSLGLPAVLSVSSASSFEEVQASGFTQWTPPLHGQTRAGFLRTVVSSVYQERVLAEAAIKATQFALPPRSRHRPSASNASICSLEQLSKALEKRAGQQKNLKITTSPGVIRRKPVNTTWQPETPDTPYPVQRHNHRQSIPGCDQRETEYGLRRDSLQDSLISPIRNSVVLHSLGMTSTASTRLGATLFPMEYPTTSPQDLVLTPVSFPQVSRPPSRRSTSPSDDLAPVVDPVDKAMKLLTQDMGFSIAEARRALAKCDTGFGIDVQKALEMLTCETGCGLSTARALRPKTPTSPVKPSAPTSPVKPRIPMGTCSGHHERDASSDSNSCVEATKPFEPMCDTHPVRQPSLLGNLNRNSLRGLARMTSKAKAYTLGMDRSETSQRVAGAEESRPTRISSLKAAQSSVERHLQSLPASQRPKSKIPPRKAKGVNPSKLMGIDEEPCVKAMQILGVDEIEVVNGRLSPAAGPANSKSKPAKPFYEGRFSNLSWSDAGSMK